MANALIVSSPARASLSQFNRDELREIRRNLGLIQLDPAPDNRHKLVVPRPPVVYTVYVTPQFWIWYYVRSQTVIITTIERARGYIPMPW